MKRANAYIEDDDDYIDDAEEEDDDDEVFYSTHRSIASTSRAGDADIDIATQLEQEYAQEPYDDEGDEEDDDPFDINNDQDIVQITEEQLRKWVISTCIPAIQKRFATWDDLNPILKWICTQMTCYGGKLFQ